MKKINWQIIIVTLCVGFGLWAILLKRAHDYRQIADKEAQAFKNFEPLTFPADKTPLISVEMPRFTISNSIPVKIKFLQGRQGQNKQWAREMAIRLDDASQKQLHWQTLKTNFDLNIGDKQGKRTIQFAFRYHWNYKPFQYPFARTRTGVEPPSIWISENITADTRPLDVTIISPTSNVFTQPLVQLRGYCRRTLTKINYQLVGVDGVARDGRGFAITDPEYDPKFYENPAEPTRNWFQFFDLKLQQGTNWLSLRFKDDCGRSCTTNLVWIYNTENSTSHPALYLDWPQPGTTISGSHFTARAHVDTPGVEILAYITGNGETVRRTGVTGRNGEVWVDNIPLLGQTNLLKLTAIDPAGNISQTRVTIFRSTVEVKIDPFDRNLLKRSTIRLTGTVSEENYAVWVNGVRAEVAGKKWSAENVPVSAGGEASFNIKAVPVNDEKR